MRRKTSPSWVLELPKYARLVRRQASSRRAQGTDQQGQRYFVQVIVEGVPYQKPKNQPGSDTPGLDIGPSTLAVVPREGEAQLVEFCEELRPDNGKKRRLQRKMQRQRRANNPHNYDERGRVKRHGKLVNDLLRMGHHMRIEKTCFKGWQKRYGKSIALRAPGLFVVHLTRAVAKTGGSLTEVPTSQTKLSQYCHNCKRYVKKPLSQRWHTCSCGLGPVQRDLYSACLLAYLDPPETVPSITHDEWAGVASRLKAVVEALQQRANEGRSLPRSFGITGARARRPKSPQPNRQELASLSHTGRLEALELAQEPPLLESREIQV
jgi:hypothetical protein